jgi:hypothetical protein
MAGSQQPLHHVGIHSAQAYHAELHALALHKVRCRTEEEYSSAFLQIRELDEASWLCQPTHGPHYDASKKAVGILTILTFTGRVTQMNLVFPLPGKSRSRAILVPVSFEKSGSGPSFL